MRIHTMMNRTSGAMITAAFFACMLMASVANGQVLYENIKLYPSVDDPHVIERYNRLLASDDVKRDESSQQVLDAGAPIGPRMDGFGMSIAISSGNGQSVVAVGAFGTVSLFDATTGEQVFKIRSDGGVQISGWNVAIDFGFGGDVARGVVAAGTSRRKPVESSVSLFDVATSTQVTKFVPNDGEHHRFGLPISINLDAGEDGIVAVGARQSVYLFDALTGEQLFKLIPNDGNAAAGIYGFPIAIDSSIGGGIVAVGVSKDGDDFNPPGAAYLFDATTGEQLFKLLPDDSVANDRFGESIALESGIVAVAGFGRSRVGSVYLFDALTGIQIGKLLSSDDENDGRLWPLVAMDSGIVAVMGSYRDDDGTDSYSRCAYLFDVATGNQIAKLQPSEGTVWAKFGHSISINNGIVAIGSHNDINNGINTGSVYLFDISHVLKQKDSNIEVAPAAFQPAQSPATVTCSCSCCGEDCPPAPPSEKTNK